MNPDSIKTREEALALVEADLITIQDYVDLCGFNGWNPAPDRDAPVSVQQRAPANRNEHPAAQRAASRSGTRASRSEPAVPARARPLALAITSA